MRYLWNVFRQPSKAMEPGTDVAEVLAGYAAVTPLRAHEGADDALEKMKSSFAALLDPPGSPQ